MRVFIPIGTNKYLRVRYNTEKKSYTKKFFFRLNKSDSTLEEH